MSSRTLLWQLEKSFDTGEIILNKEFSKLFQAICKKNWQNVYKFTESYFSAESDPEKLAFVLQWAVAVSEIEFNMDRRNKLLLKWDAIPDWASSEYCRYLRNFQEALSNFFSGNLKESDLRFKKSHEIAMANQYERGQMRSLFHLGLVQRDLGNPPEAEEYWLLARERATALHAESMIKRIDCELDHNTGVAVQFTQIRYALEHTLKQHNFREAWKLYLQAERIRKANREGRARESFYVYLPFFAWALVKKQRAKKLFDKIQDPILRIHVLSLKQEVMGLRKEEENLLAALKELHSVSSTIVRNSLAPLSTVICGKAIYELPSKDVQSLLLLLLEKKSGVDKEQISKNVWGLVYDTVIHDGKIYKLLHKTRQLLGKKDLILNTYGAYELNPKYLNKEQISLTA